MKNNSENKNDKESSGSFFQDCESLHTRIINGDTTCRNSFCTSEGLTDEELQNQVEQPDWSKLEGSFSDLHLIGMGGMGTVFSAKDSLFYRNVALKILRGELRNKDKSVRTFIREARITAQIDHPNIVPVYNLGIFKEMGAYFSMKKIEGITLAEILKKLEENDPEFEKEYTLRRRLEIFISVCNGIAFAHSKGVVHCDLKPGNIMVGDYGEVFVMDWGMAIYCPDKDMSPEHSKIVLGDKDSKNGNDKNFTSETVNGTPAFMAPEQIFGKIEQIDEQTDVYALGILLYTILTCTQSPFPPRLPSEEIFEKALTGNFLPPRKRAPKRRISNELEIVCLKAMSPYKHERYPNVMALMQDIRNILDMHPVEVYNSPILNFIKYCRRHPMIPTALVGALITLGVFYSYFTFSNMMSARALKQILTLTIDESVPLYGRYHAELKNYQQQLDREKGYERFFGEHKDFEMKNISAKLDLNCNQILESLFKLNEVTENSKYLPMIMDALNFCIQYSLDVRKCDNIKKIQQIDSGLFYTAYKNIIRKNSALRRKLQLIAISSGELVFNTPDKNIEVFISRQIDQDWDGVSNDSTAKRQNAELILKHDSFSTVLKTGEYSLLITDGKNRNITIPVDVQAGEKIKIDLTFPAYIPDDCVYIHEGNYYSNISHHYSIGRKIYVDSFFLLDREVTIDEYKNFWMSVKDSNLRQKYNPDILFRRDGRYVVEKLFAADGKILAPYTGDMPVAGISAAGAQAYCSYISQKTGMKCRLPYFVELEKAARGTGRRLFVWGNRFYSEYALLADSPQIKKYPLGAPPKTFANDYSLYGVYDLTGNVRELVQLKNSADSFAVYGGSYRNTANYAKCGNLSRFTDNHTDVGMRYVIEVPKNKEKPKK
ncbi:MAG: protein kinase [Lentisphaeria bacterium]|nr:protein kinase [Lentisphaeria bacterium]